MTYLYLPVYKVAVAYIVKYGRRWTALEHLLLGELSRERQSIGKLAELANLPERVIVEALINLLRASWVEVRTSDEGTYFTATPLGQRRAEQTNLPYDPQRKVRWISLCVDRLTGAWLRADDLDLLHERDLPDDAIRLDPIVGTFDTADGILQQLVHLSPDESFVEFEPTVRSSAKLYARVEVAFDKIDGLPAYAPLALRDTILRLSPKTTLSSEERASTPPNEIDHGMRDTLSADDFVIGGAANFELVKTVLTEAAQHVIIHSCFLDASVLDRLLPDFMEAAERGVRVELLWGLHTDPEDATTIRPFADSLDVLKKVPERLRKRISISPVSSGSHAKVILYDTKAGWITVLSSCNFLSSYYDLIEVSLQSRSQKVAASALARLTATQLPASGSWPPIARRLNRLWNELRVKADKPETGDHRLELIADADHYACITMARDEARSAISVGCDLFGMAAETSVLVPLERAAELGNNVQLYYRRASRLLQAEGRTPNGDELRVRGLVLEQRPKLHGKFLAWGDEAIAVTSFNWLSTVVAGTRSTNSELGILVRGAGLKEILAKKLLQGSGGAIHLP